MLTTIKNPPDLAPIIAALERITAYVDGMKDLTTEVKGYSPRIILMQLVAELQFAIAAVDGIGK